jgi:putative transposon-encoded protein
MSKIRLIPKNELTIKNIRGFLKRKVTPFGTGAKVDCSKEFLGKTVYLIMTDE